MLGCLNGLLILMTRYAHVGDLGKTAVQLIRGSKVKQKHCAIRRKDLFHKPLKLSGHQRGNIGGHVLGWTFSWA